VGEVPIKLTMDGPAPPPFFLIQDSNWGPLGTNASYLFISQVCDVACPPLFLIQQRVNLKVIVRPDFYYVLSTFLSICIRVPCRSPYPGSESPGTIITLDGA